MSNSQRFSQFTNNPGNKTGQQAQQQTPSKRQTVQTGFPSSSRSDSDSISDVSMSNENLSNEERFVLRHTSRVEPQGQENHLAGNLTPVNEIQPPSRFSSNTSTDSTRYVTNSNRSISENRTPVFSGISPYSNPTASESNRSSIIVHTANNSNRNSIKETNSNRSSMDTSYNTLIIHNDEGIYALNREYSSPPPYLKKDRPRSYGEQQQMGGMQEITEIPEEYLNQSHVLKHLAKEVKIPNRQLPNSTRDSGLSENTDSRDHLSRPYNWMIVDDLSQNTKMKSKSQPDLTRLMVGEMDIDIEALIKENSVLRQQLQNCYSRVAKSQKLEHEVAKIYRDHEDLVNSSERRERLERAARNRLQSDCRRLQELNRALRDQVEVLQQQLLTQPNDQNGRSAQHDALISQLVTQNKELVDANKRQYIEIQAQSATLEEQRIHINVLDTALKRLEEECRQKQLYVAQLQHALQSLQCSERREQVDRKLRYDYDSEISKDSNRSGSGETNNLKWQLREKDNKIMRLENECATLQQRNLEESRNVAKITMEKNTQETERVMAEAKQEKLRYLDETHSANRKVTELQTRLKVVENRLNEKDAMIRALQVYGSSNYGGSYNLSSDSFALGYNNSTNGGGGQASFDVSSNSYDNSLLDAHGSVQSTSDFSPSSSIATAYATSNYGQTNPTFNQSAINLHVNHVNYSPNSSSNYSSNYGAPNTSYTQTGNLVDDPIFDAQRKSIGDQLKQLDEQLLNKRGFPCCFPSLSAKKPIQSLLAEEMSMLSTNNSDAFLQNLAQIEKREHQRHDRHDQDLTKPDDMVLLEKQGRCSQKLRNNTVGNLAQISIAIGQNMTDISNIGNSSPTSKVPKIVSNLTQNLANITQAALLPPRKDRGNSLPPSALPRPPRSLKPPRKIEYGRLSDSDSKKRSQTPPKSSISNTTVLPPQPVFDPQKQYELKTSSLKRNAFSNVKRDFSPCKNYLEMKESLNFNKVNEYSGMKPKNYGSINKIESKFGFKPNDFCKPEYTSTKNYQRLDDSLHHEQQQRKNSQDSSSIKRSFLPGTRKFSNVLTPSAPLPLSSAKNNPNKGSHDSLNSVSSGSNSSPVHSKTDSNASTATTFNQHNTQFNQTRMTPPMDTNNFLQKSKLQNSMLTKQIKTTSLPSSSVLHAASVAASSSSSLPPKPLDLKLQRRGTSLTRGENKYRIQF